jgi:hypothetical protein
MVYHLPVIVSYSQYVAERNTTHTCMTYSIGKKTCFCKHQPYKECQKWQGHVLKNVMSRADGHLGLHVHTCTNITVRYRPSS